MKGERIHWPVGERTRCGIRVVRTQRISRSGYMTAPRRVYAGQTIDVPGFLALEDRCRHCARRLRQDTGLVKNMDRERVRKPAAANA